MNTVNDKATKIKYTALCVLIIIQSSFQCEISSVCHCSVDYEGKYDYICPEIQIYPRPNSLVDLICTNPDNTNIDEILTEIQIESFDKFNIKELRFTECQLTQSFPTIFRKFNISNLETINYEYTNSLDTFFLTADNLLGLEGIKDLILTAYVPFGEVEQTATIAPDIFKYLNKLRYLKLEMKLEELPIGVFDNMFHLEVLLLPSDYLNNLDVDILKDLVNLHTLDLSNNSFTEIPETIFRRNINLKMVNLNYNLLTTLPNKLFANLPNLVQVLLKNCELVDLPENLFQGSNSLMEIDLSSNFLQSLPEYIFNGLNSLKHLDISNNRIGQIFVNTFNGLGSLKSLYLAGNALDSLNEDQFRKLKLIEIIDLSYNNLATLPVTLFQETLQLKEIYLESNCLKIPYTKFELFIFSSNTNLEVINLSYNNISYFNSDYISNKSKLRELDLTHNQIKSINIRHFQSNSNATEIDFRNNEIVSIDFNDAEEVSNNRSTDQNIILKLDDNPIHCDCFSYSFLKYFDKTANFPASKFITIEADNLKCNSSNDTLVKNVNLETVTCPLEDFSLPKCSDVCNCHYRPWDGSIIVDCENKNLTRVPKITWPNNLTDVDIDVKEVEINLKRNLLISGPSVTSGYGNITKLFLSFNNISEMNWIPPKLKVLELNNNNLNNFNEVMMAQVNSSVLDTITLGNNPWSCDCSSLPLYEYLVSNRNRKRIDISNITCEEHGKSMILLTPEDLCLISIIYIVCAICVVIIIIICIIVIVYHYHEDNIKVWLYAHNMCMRFVTEEDVDKDKIYDAFISYSHVDEAFILNDLQPTLESGPNPYKLCLHVRDWVPGKEIAKQISDSIQESRRTLVILSSNFLESIWGTLEFKTAHNQAMKEGRSRVILIIYGDLNLENLDGELKSYVKTNTYIKWGDPWFWNKLKYALPHKK